MWIARDKFGELYLFSEKPELNSWGEWYTRGESIFLNEEGWNVVTVQLANNAFPEVTFENSPKELVIKWD